MKTILVLVVGVPAIAGLKLLLGIPLTEFSQPGQMLVNMSYVALGGVLMLVQSR
jgi:hypothetical protein